MKYIIIGILVLAVLFGGYFLFTMGNNTDIDSATQEPEMINKEETAPTINDTTEEPETVEVSFEKTTVIGQSLEGRDIIAESFGNGQTEILFVGGMHGSFANNTVSLANKLIKYIKENPEFVSENNKITIIPNLNPDGYQKTGTAGRFNANNVDLNRNFDCEWQKNAVWRDQNVSAGSSPFSEPESKVLRDYVQNNRPKSVVVWYTTAGGVYASTCSGQVSATVMGLVDAYADASGYTANNDFDFYEVTGDATNWMAKIGVPAIAVLLGDANSDEWSKNLAGIRAFISETASSN